MQKIAILALSDDFVGLRRVPTIVKKVVKHRYLLHMSS